MCDVECRFLASNLRSTFSVYLLWVTLLLDDQLPNELVKVFLVCDEAFASYVCKASYTNLLP
jgi:hypothetical protein